MNLISFTENDFIKRGIIELKDRRFEHIHHILRVKIGDILTVGQINGSIGFGQVIDINDKKVCLTVDLNQRPPQALPLILIMPLVRPPVLKRMLLTAASLGIKEIHISNFNRVEKSLWTSSALKKEVIDEQLILGLEQAKDTVLPQVYVHRLLKPFVEDVLPSIIKGRVNLVAHPGSKERCPVYNNKSLTLVIGPEGGMVDSEIKLLKQVGFDGIDLGKRILKVETVLPFIIGRIFG